MTPGDHPGSIITSRAYRTPVGDRLDDIQVIDRRLPHMQLVPLAHADHGDMGLLSVRVVHRAIKADVTLTAADVLALRDALNEWLHPELLTPRR